MPTMNEIEDLTRDYARARDLLTKAVDSLELAMKAERDKRIAGVKGLVGEAANARNRLAAAIEKSPDLFVRPRTVVVDGVKVGFQKSKGKVVFSLTADKVVAKIRALFSKAKAESLIKVEETPIKKALENLPADELKKIGVKIDGAGDEVYIAPIDGAVQKLVDALLKDAVDKETADE